MGTAPRVTVASSDRECVDELRPAKTTTASFGWFGCIGCFGCLCCVILFRIIRGLALPKVAIDCCPIETTP